VVKTIRLFGREIYQTETITEIETGDVQVDVNSDRLFEFLRKIERELGRIHGKLR
jgi:hypothetical protein